MVMPTFVQDKKDSETDRDSSSMPSTDTDFDIAWGKGVHLLLARHVEECEWLAALL
jgi:hypothetical protein